MTDNERVSLLTQLLNASVAVPLMILLTVRYGPLGLGTAFLASLVVNNTTELLVLYRREGLVPFSREQLYAALSVVPAIAFLLVTKAVAGTGWGVLAAAAVTGGYVWLSGWVLLQESDRAAIRAWLR